MSVVTISRGRKIQHGASRLNVVAVAAGMLVRIPRIWAYSSQSCLRPLSNVTHKRRMGLLSTLVAIFRGCLIQ